MEKLTLLKPCAEFARQIIEYRNEFIECGDSMDGCGTLRRTDDPYEFIKNCRDFSHQDTVPDGFVTADLYMLVREADGKLIGMTDIRHYLNEYLAKYGGHIGYSVRPSERRRGYAKEILRLALLKCRELGIKRVLVTCDAKNIASEKTILANGGIADGAVTGTSDNSVTKRYWIEV